MAAEYTDGDAVDIIEWEGLNYAVQHYCSGECFKDADTARLWSAAGEALNGLEAHLEASTGREL